MVVIILTRNKKAHRPRFFIPRTSLDIVPEINRQSQRIRKKLRLRY